MCLVLFSVHSDLYLLVLKILLKILHMILYVCIIYCMFVLYIVCPKVGIRIIPTPKVSDILGFLGGSRFQEAGPEI